jgi:hypothetical protein
MSYNADRRVQITLMDGEATSLRVHEDRGDGTPLCNTPLRDWKGQPAQYKKQGKGEVNCGLCARTYQRGK